MIEKFRLSKPARVLAGVSAVLLALGGALTLAMAGHRRDGAGMLAVAALLAYGAARGRSPAWLEDPREAERALDRLTRRDRTP